MRNQDTADHMLDEKLRDLLTEIEKEPVSEETRRLAAQLQEMLNDHKAVATAKG